MLHLYLSAINSDRCPDAVAALAVMLPVIALIAAFVVGFSAVASALAA